MYSQDHLFVSSDSGYEIPPSPEMLADEIPLLLSVDPCQVYRTLALDVSDHLRHRVFRWDRDHHMHMISQQMPFLDLALLLRC